MKYRIVEKDNFDKTGKVYAIQKKSFLFWHFCEYTHNPFVYHDLKLAKARLDEKVKSEQFYNNSWKVVSEK